MPIRLICYYLRWGAGLVARGLTRSTAFAATAVAPVMSGVCCGRRQPNGVAFAPIANVRRKVRSQTKEHVFPPIPQQRSLAWDANPEPDIAKYKVYWGLQSGVPSEPFDVGNVTTATIATLNEATFIAGSVAWTIRRSRQLFFGPRYGLSITH
jgi:hypothetical protein